MVPQAEARRTRGGFRGPHGPHDMFPWQMMKDLIKRTSGAAGRRMCQKCSRDGGPRQSSRVTCAARMVFSKCFLLCVILAIGLSD